MEVRSRPVLVRLRIALAEQFVQMRLRQGPRAPALLAKMATTFDEISNGRQLVFYNSGPYFQEQLFCKVAEGLRS